jgi:hypothetical protein
VLAVRVRVLHASVKDPTARLSCALLFEWWSDDLSTRLVKDALHKQVNNADEARWPRSDPCAKSSMIQHAESMFGSSNLREFERVVILFFSLQTHSQSVQSPKALL